MKTIQEVYTEYRIMPSLQLHQLRVASVSKIICENFQDTIDFENVILACLFHDMGNIIKSDLARFPYFLKPEGIEYWESVKREYVEKYGNDEHHATEMIAREINIPDSAFKLLAWIGFTKLDKVETRNHFENKICNYSDMRVGPHGVISIEERLIDGKKRYEERTHSVLSENFEPLSKSLKHIEDDIFLKSNIKPEDIDNKKVDDYIDELRNYSI